MDKTYESERAITSDPLEHEIAVGPLLKIRRANQHISDLNWQVADYLAKVPFELRVRQSEKPPERLIYIEAKHSIPDTFALILGDAVHNLRTAVDQLCFGMVGHKAKSPRQVGFPFVKNRESLSGAINTRQMHLAPKNVIAELHQLKPYPNGNKFLHAVHSLDERDKHHFILTVGIGIQLSGEQLGSLVGPENVAGLGLDTLIATVGDFGMKLNPAFPIDTFDRAADFQSAFTIGFGQGEVLASEPVIPSLVSMAQETEHAVARMMYAYVG